MEEGEFSPLELACYGSIQLSHFSMIGVTQEGEKIHSIVPDSTTAKLHPQYGVYFVITKDLEVFITVSYLIQ